MPMTIQESNKLIIQALAAGKTYKEIAAEMHMKTRTVKNRLQKMKKKLDCITTTQLVLKVIAFNHGNFHGKE